MGSRFNFWCNLPRVDELLDSSLHAISPKQRWPCDLHSISFGQYSVWIENKIRLCIWVYRHDLVKISIARPGPLDTHHNLRVCARKTSKFAILLSYENPCVFFVFHFMLLYFSPNECPGLCWHRPGHLLGEKIK